MLRAATSFVLVVATISPAFAGPQALLDPDAAVAQSQATGRPILAIAGSTGCVWCKKMAAELASDPAVQEPAAKFVVLLLDTDDPVRWPRWNSRYKVEGEGIPAVFVVRADGEQIYGGNGAPRDLARFLELRLADAGTVLDDEALAAMTASARTLTRGWRRRDPKPVIAELNGLLDPQNHSAPAQQIAEIAEQMRKLAGSQLAAAERDLKEPARKPDAAFEAAVTALALRRDYAELSDFGEDLQSRVAALEQEPKTAPILERAAKIVDAETLYEADKREDAIAALRSLAADHAGTPAAAYADRMCARWEKGQRSGESERIAEESEPAGETPPSTSADAERAATQVRLGKLLRSGNPGKAQDYFKRAIELAPDSPAAVEARELLGQ